MTVNQEKTGSYYPVRDSCDKEGDPSEKCILTDALFYQGHIPVEKDNVNVKITNKDIQIVNQAYAKTVTSYLSKSDLGCEDEEYSFLCFFLLVMIALLIVVVKVVFGIHGMKSVL